MKTALITGGATRLGKAISKALAKQNYTLFITYHTSHNEALKLQKEIEANGGTVFLYQCDLSKPAIAEELAKKAIKKLNKIDLLINNAALFFPTKLGTVTEQQWHMLHDLNLKAAFFLSQEVGLHMQKNGSGQIINIGDTAHSIIWKNYLPYSLTKAGINSLTIGLAKTLAPQVRVNCINPGPVLLPKNFTNEEKKKAIEPTLLKRVGTPQDIIKAIHFLIDSDYITGVSLPVDGGRHLG